MRQVTLPGLPDRRAMDFAFDVKGKEHYARVIYRPVESKPDRIEIRMQAWEVDANGVNVTFSTGEPSRTAQTPHVIVVSGISANTHTLEPGWVRVPPRSGAVISAEDAESLPEGTTIANELPAVGALGDRVVVGDTLYAWSEGLLVENGKAKAEELRALILNSDMLTSIDL